MPGFLGMYSATPDNCHSHFLDIFYARSVLVNTLASHLDPQYTHFNKKCVDISTPPGSTRSVVHFADGTSVEADVVLVASGIKSSVRSVVTGRPSEANVAYSRTNCYRGLVPLDQARAAGVKADYKGCGLCYIGAEKVCSSLSGSIAWS